MPGNSKAHITFPVLSKTRMLYMLGKFPNTELSSHPQNTICKNKIISVSYRIKGLVGINYKLSNFVFFYSSLYFILIII